MLERLEKNYLVYTLFIFLIILCLNKTGIYLIISLLGIIATLLCFIKKESKINKTLLYLLRIDVVVNPETVEVPNTLQTVTTYTIIGFITALIGVAVILKAIDLKKQKVN